MTLQLTADNIEELIELLQENLYTGDLAGDDAILGRVLIAKLRSELVGLRASDGFRVSTRIVVASLKN